MAQQQVCPRCGSTNVQIEMYKEDLGSRTVIKTKSKYKEKGHGILWWLFIGWWWWFIDLMIWICAFPARFLFYLGRKKSYEGKSKTVSTTKNNMKYKTMCLCKDCGKNWDASGLVQAFTRKQKPTKSSQATKSNKPANPVNARMIVQNLNNPDCSLAVISSLAEKKTFTIPELSIISNYDNDRAINVATALLDGGFVNRELVDGQNLYMWTDAARK